MWQRRDTATALAVAAVSVAAMAIDHLIGTHAERDEPQPAEPIAFVASVTLALALTFALFRFVVTPTRDVDRAGRRAILYAMFAVVTVPLLFLAVPFPFAGSAVALGLRGRDGARRRLATAAIAVGVVILALGLGVYVVELAR